MPSVDNRVVAMKFDNKDFERNVGTSMKTLDRLKAALGFKGATKGLEDVSKAAGNTKGFDQMGGAVDTVKAKFGVLQTVGIAALASVTTKAVDAGVKLAKALTLDNIIDGFKEYETNINSVQTILANTESKGGTLEGVNKALDDLNLYADKTIYNFSEMTRNIGTFTAAGVGLDESVRSIKGIANIAAVSGSNSQQASTAMYQLSQAIAAGSVKLQDWNSVVNAGMGGEVLQQALFETGKALGTLTDVPLTQSFEEWKAEGNSFRETLQDGWITSEVLTTTLEGFTGELSDAELAAKGYSQEQIAAIQKMAQTATDAATQVKTATQLVGVIQEAIGSGWASTFRIVIGDFEEAKALFSGIAEAITGPIGRMTEARNALLQGWKDNGGRDQFFAGLLNAFDALGKVVGPIRLAFRELFPRTTVETLVNLSTKFAEFTDKLKIGEETQVKVYNAFRIFFSVIKTGFEVMKGVGRVFGAVVGAIFKVGLALGKVFVSLTGPGVSSITNFLGNGERLTGFFDLLVDVVNNASNYMVSGIEAIGSVLGKLGGFFEPILEQIGEFKDKIVGLFPSGGGGDGGPGFFASALDKVASAFDRVQDAGEPVANFLATVGDFFGKIGGVVADAAKGVGNFFTSFFSSIGGGLDNAADLLVKAFAGGALAGIAAALARFAKDGFKLDFGQFDFLEKLDDLMGGVEETLNAFATNLKAQALKEVAVAIGILAASLFALSFLETEEIVTGLGAIAAAMSGLLLTLSTLSKIEGTGVSMTAMAASLTALAVGILVLSGAVYIFSRFNWEELARGMVGVGVSIGLLVLAAKGLQNASGRMIFASIGLTAISVGLIAFGAAVKLISSIKLTDMIKGLLAVFVGLDLFVRLMNTVDEKSTFKIASGLLIFSFALGSFQKVIASFAGMSWTDLLKGFAGMAATLLIIAGAVALLPKNTEILLVAAGLLVMAGAIFIMTMAIERIAQLSIGQLITGLIAVAAMLAILVVASSAMTGTVVGAAAIIVLSGALWVMAEVLEKIGNLGLGTILVGLLGIAGVLIVLGLAAAALAAFPPLLGALILMSAALIAIGLGFTLMGAGAYLAARALEIMSNVGGKAMDKLIEFMDKIIRKVPEWARVFAEGVGEFIIAVLEMGPEILEAFGGLFDAIINFIIEKTPMVSELFAVLLQAGIDLMREKVPEFIDLAIFLLLSFGKAISDNIGMMVEIGKNIIVNFLNGIAEAIPEIAEAAVGVLVAWIEAIGDNIQRVIDAGVELVGKFLEGIGNAAIDLATFIGNLIAAFGEATDQLITAGVTAAGDFLDGLADDAELIAEKVGNFLEDVAGAALSLALTILDIGTDFATTILDGLIKDTVLITNKVRDFLNAIAFAAGVIIPEFVDTGVAIVEEVFKGIAEAGDRIGFAAVIMILSLIKGFTDNSFLLFVGSMQLLYEFLLKLEKAIKIYVPLISATARRIGWAIIDGISGGLFSKTGGLFKSMWNIGRGALSWFGAAIGFNSPAKEFIKAGKSIPEGLVLALDGDKTAQRASRGLAKRTLNSFEEGMKKAAYDISKMKDINPTIKPVLDLDDVKKEAKTLGTILDGSKLSADVSFANAQVISAQTSTVETEPTAETGGDTYVSFEQNNYSPKELSTADIYRQTRGQITLAKEELKIP